MERKDIPEVPAEWKQGVDYRQELEAARLARSSYLSESDMRNADVRVNPDYPHLFDSQLLGRQLTYLRHRGGDDLAPQTDHTRAQMERVQQALLPGDAWHPQFGHALDFAREVRDTYARGIASRWSGTVPVACTRR